MSDHSSGCSRPLLQGGVPQSGRCGDEDQRSHPRPPRWASRSVREDAGVIHERLCSVHPVVQTWPGAADMGDQPTDVSLSVIDLRAREGWDRQSPTIQVEGGSYSPAAARALQQAVAEALSYLESPGVEPQ